MIWQIDKFVQYFENTLSIYTLLSTRRILVNAGFKMHPALLDANQTFLDFLFCWAKFHLPAHTESPGSKTTDLKVCFEGKELGMSEINR